MQLNTQTPIKPVMSNFHTCTSILYSMTFILCGDLAKQNTKNLLQRSNYLLTSSGVSSLISELHVINV